MTDAGDGGDIRLRDEILELLYWLEGEGFHSHATIDGMMRFLAFPIDDVRRVLDRMVERGDVARAADDTVSLTPEGHRDAALRFADDFGSYLKQGHGECNDPSCECHENPESAAECHARALAREDGA